MNQDCVTHALAADGDYYILRSGRTLQVRSRATHAVLQIIEPPVEWGSDWMWSSCEFDGTRCVAVDRVRLLRTNGQRAPCEPVPAPDDNRAPTAPSFGPQSCLTPAAPPAQPPAARAVNAAPSDGRDVRPATPQRRDGHAGHVAQPCRQAPSRAGGPPYNARGAE